MHAHLHQLLSLRDGEPVAGDAARHVEDCALCTQRLADLHSIRQGLRALPEVVAAGPDGWLEVERRIAARSGAPRRRVRIGVVAAAASLASLGVLAGLRLQDRALNAPAGFPDLGASVAADSTELSIAELQQQSLQLEALLASLPERPAVERAATALPIETLEAQVQWVDHRLSEFEAAPASSEAEAERLWRDRIGIMNSLVQLRYVEAQRLAL
jgi:hypothetical protein